jgi:hypothetical protein
VSAPRRATRLTPDPDAEGAPAFARGSFAGVKMPTDWTTKVKAAIIDLERGGRVLDPSDALAVIDDVVEGKLAADELTIIHGLPKDWIATTLGHVTKAVQGSGRVRLLAAGGWYAFHGHEQPYEVAPGFAAAWKVARGW